MAWANARGKGAAQVMKNHIRAQKTKGNRKPGTKRATSQSSSASRVGGHVGGNFDQ